MRIVPLRRSRTRAFSVASLAVAVCLGSGVAASASHAAGAAVPGSVVDVAADAPAFVSAGERALAASPAATVPDRAGTVGEPHARSAAPAGAPAAALPATDALKQLPAASECPTGMSRAGTLYSGGFEDKALPEPTFTKGWSIVSGGRTGSYAAKSSINAADASTQPSGSTMYWPLAIPYVTAPSGGRTIVRYAIKGDYPEDAAYVAVNGESGWAAPSSSWGLVTLDVTDAITAADANALDIRFANFPANPATNSTIYLDDIEVYTCRTGAAGSRVRGDYTGDGIADMVTVNGAGDLQVWPGTGDFRLGSPRTAGSGWTGATWLGSAGDLNGDGKADILARFTNGDLIVYYGDGAGAFTTGSRKVGNGWNGINAIVPMGDINGDGLPDFLARDTSGNMRRYWLTSVGGGLTGGTIVGVGFDAFSSLFSMGDFDKDGRFDLTGILTNGDMRVYTTLATGALWGTGQKIGNGWAFRQVSSPGDFNKDGFPDVIAQDGSGNILTYPVLGGGRWGGYVRTGTGFGGYRLIG